MNDDNNPAQPPVVKEAPTETPPQQAPLNDVRPPVKTPPPMDKPEADKSTAATPPPKPQKISAPKDKASYNSAITATVIIIVVIAALIVFAYTKSK